MAQTETGVDASLSKVLDLASKGTIAGPIDMEEKKMVIPINPVNNCCIGMFRPMKNARKRKNGAMSP
jgi:hypothetical protein